MIESYNPGRQKKKELNNENIFRTKIYRDKDKGKGYWKRTYVVKVFLTNQVQP